MRKMQKRHWFALGISWAGIVLLAILHISWGFVPYGPALLGCFGVYGLFVARKWDKHARL
jgi:hypothetical protein